MDARGMIGRIYLTGGHTSWVILLTDLNSRIPGHRVVARQPPGDHGGRQYRHAVAGHAVPVVTCSAGDQIVSSGDGGAAAGTSHRHGGARRRRIARLAAGRRARARMWKCWPSASRRNNRRATVRHSIQAAGLPPPLPPPLPPIRSLRPPRLLSPAPKPKAPSAPAAPQPSASPGDSPTKIDERRMAIAGTRRCCDERAASLRICAGLVRVGGRTDSEHADIPADGLVPSPLLGLVPVYFWCLVRPDLMTPPRVFAIGVLEDILSAVRPASGTLSFVITYAVIDRQRDAFAGLPGLGAVLGFATAALITCAMRLCHHGVLLLAHAADRPHRQASWR